MKKRIINLLLCAVVLIGLLPTSALAAVANTINPGDTLESDGIWQDPATKYQYIYEVYQDTENDHSLYAELIGVTINSEATGIELTIPGTVPYTPVGESEQQIPLRVISGVNSNAIKSVSIPASVEIISANVFKNYSNLETVTFVGSSNLKTIGDSAFYYCHALKSCVLPETVEMIGGKAFYFTSLTSVRFGTALKTLGSDAFAHCYSLAELDMSKATLLKEIPESCFAYHALTSLTIPNWVEAIGDWAFAGLGGPNDPPGPLTSLNFGNGVKTIGEYAFNGNTNLTGKLILPDSVSSIGKGAFAACGYTDVKWPQGNGDFTVVNGFSQCRSLTGAAIESLPLSVTTIGEEAFWDCINLGSVTIPASVRTIQEKAFYAAGITSLTIANGVQTIETNAFQNCAELLGTEITIPASVNRLASGAFSELFTLNADGKVDDSKSLTVKVMNPDLVLAEATGDYQYFAADDTGHTNPSYTGDAFAGCVNLILYAPAGASTAKAYADKFNGVIIQATKENINFWYSPRKVEFRELTDVPVYHTVTLPDGGSDVTFTVKQNGKTLTPVSNGVFSAEHGKEVVVTAHREDYYNQVLVKQGADFTGDWTVKLGTWEALPVSGKLLVNITEDGLSLGSFDGLTLSLTENVGNDDVPFTASYPYLVLPAEHGLSADTELTLTVTPDASMQLTGGSATSTLRDSSFTVALKGWGKAAVTATGTSAAPCVVILFDDVGNAVSSGTTSGGVFTSDPLPAGTYTAVAYETNDYFGAVGSKAALSSLGLSTNDYAKGSVTIADCSTKELTLTVPKLNTGNLTSVLDTKKCSLAFRSRHAVTGQAFDMQVNYALKTGSAQKITFTLPAGASIQSVYDEQGWLPVTDNSVTVNNASGTLYVSLVCTGTGVKSFGASVTTGGTILPLGSGTITVQNIFIEEADSYTAKRTGARVSVYTTPGASVTLTIPGAATVNGTANAAGRTTLTYSLPDGAVDGQSYILTVSANGGSARTSVTYLPDSAELQWFGFRHHGQDITVIDHIHPENENTYYTYYALGDEASKYFSFSATIKADQELKVTATVTMQDGSVRSVPMAQVEETNGIRKFAGELYLEGNTADHVFHADSIPVGFGISWEDSGKVQFNGEAIYLQALQRAREQREARESILESVNGKDVEVAPFFGYAYRTVGTQAYYDCLMTQSEYEEICAALDQLTGVEDTEKAAFKENILDKIYSTVDDCVALAHSGDKLMDDAADFLTRVIQQPNPLQTYDSWDDVLSDMRVSADKSSPTDQQLADNDFTQVKSSWCKLGEKPNEGFTVAWPNGYDGGSQTPSGGTGSGEQYTGNATVSVSSLKDAEGQNWSDQVRAAGSHALGNGAKLLNEQAAKMAAVNGHVNDWLARQSSNTWDTFMNELGVRKEIAAREKLVNTELNKACISKALGVGVGAYNMFSDADQLNQNIVKTAESEAKASELDVLIQYYTTHVAPAGCLSALQDEKRAYELLNDLMNQKSNHLMLNVGVGAVSLALEFTTAGVSSTAAMTYDAASGVAMYARDVQIAETQKRIEKLHAARVAACGGEGWKKAPLRNLTHILDPSGIVYEAVESNVLSGVTATIYEVSSGETLWDAGAYDQTNPLTTGADGGYAWDVPTGTWQVKFTKDGYSTAQTASLAVPPPRMNLKTEMVSTAAPTVVSAAAYPDYVELVFSQYMRVTDELTVPEGYTYEWVNKDKVNAESSTEYSKVLHLKKSAAVGETVTVTLSGAKNYVGTDLAAYSSGALTVAVEPVELRLNYETQIAVLVGEAKDPRVTVQVLDAGGQPIPGLTVTAAIEDTAYAAVTTVKGNTGEDGVAVFSVKGLLPGWAEATFAVEGSSLTKTMPVRVTIDSNQVAKPVASIGGNDYTTSTNSITVPRGSALTLTCATEDAVIYYTTNDTCPCQAMDRQLYTGPITVNEDTYFRIAAYKDGMEYSERLNLKVSVSESSSGGGGGGGYTPGYSVAVEQPESGSVTISPKSASKGDIVTVTVIPDKGYTLETLTVTDKNGNELKLTEKNGMYTFTMPASKVTVKATFMEDNSILNFFVDVPADAYYYDAVLWAAKNGITSGTSTTTFSPNADCTRAQIVTFLWRASGSPAPKSNENPFTDLKADAYYYDAVLWAVEQGITSGTGGGKFSPEAVCTRSQSVTFLYRAAGSPKVSSNASFSDVTAGRYYADAVAWDEQNGVTGGIGGGLFGSANDCTRGQIVTFLYRFFVK